MRHAFLLIVAVAITLMRVGAQSPAATGALAQRIAHTDPAAYRTSSAVHGGAGSMSFRALLNRGALTPEFNFLHRGVIPAGSGIGHHFHNVVEEMFVILDGEAQFTDRRAHREREGSGGCPLPGRPLACDLQSGAGARAVDEPERVARRRRLRQLRSRRHPRRRGARRDSHVHDDSIRQVAAESARAHADEARPVPPPAPNAVLSRRVAGPAMFSTTWSYVDHVLVPPGAATPELPHDGLAEAYYVLGGEGTISVAGVESGTAAVRAGDAIPVRIGETTRFTSTGSAPLELFVMGVARDMAAKTQLLTGAPR